MKKTGITAFLLCWVGIFSGCNTGYQPTVFDGFTQGTTFHIVIRDAVDPAIEGDIDSLFRQAEASLSLFDPASLLARLNANQTDTVDTWVADCIRLAEAVSRETDGLFDITIKPLTAAYGFAGEGRDTLPNIDSLLHDVGYEKIRLEGNRLVKATPGVQVDLNAVAQGYTVDRLVRHFDSLGLKNYIVEMGGEIFARGMSARDDRWIVGIDSPKEGNITPGADLQVRIRLSGRGLATSGNYRKFYEDPAGRKIVHTIDPKTGQPVISRILSATVIAPDAATADMYGTYFMVAGVEKTAEFLNSHPEVDAYVIYTDPDSDAPQIMATSGMELVEPTE